MWQPEPLLGWSPPPTHLLLDSLPPLPHQEGVVARSEFGRPVERHDDVPCDNVGRRLVCPCIPSWVGEGDLGLFDWNTGDCPPGDLRRGPREQIREEGVPQLILYRLKGHSYFRGNMLHKIPLLLKGLLQTRVCCLRMKTFHPSQVGH